MPPHAKSWLIGKDSDAGRDWGQEEKGTTDDQMAGWHHWLDGCEFEWPPGDGDGQGGLACCNSWGCRVGHDWATELNWTDAFNIDIPPNYEEINLIFLILQLRRLKLRNFNCFTQSQLLKSAAGIQAHVCLIQIIYSINICYKHAIYAILWGPGL